MLAVSSDIDNMNMAAFRNVHRFLNTLENTPMGAGLGLDIADSMWVFVGKGRSNISLLTPYDRSRPQAYADELTAYAHAGWIDTLHTYGNWTDDGHAPFERRHAELALAELRARDIHLTTWVNHGSRTNTQNFGFGERWAGDNPRSAAYHTDILLDYGVKFAWSHRDGATAGTDSPIAPLALRDGRRLWGFQRYNQTLGAAADEVISSHPDFYARKPWHRRERQGQPHTMLWWPGLVDAQLATERLDELVAQGQYCIAAQHLGDLDGAEHLAASAADAFRTLREYLDAGRILIARTSRLLEYSRVSQHLSFEVGRREGQVEINITRIADPVLGSEAPSLEALRGATFYVPDPERAELRIAGAQIPETEVIRAPSDGASPSIGIRWFAPQTDDQVAGYLARERFRRPSRDHYVALDGLGVEEHILTSQAMGLDELGVAHPLRNRYGPTSRRLVGTVFEQLDTGPDDVFLDLGSGRGRMLLAAATRRFKRVVGVEIAPQLCVTAQHNIDHNLKRLQCRDVSIVVADAATWPVPDDVTVVYLFNSFKGEVLLSALRQITASLECRPRDLTLVYMFPSEAELVEATGCFRPERAQRFGDKPLEQIVYYSAHPRQAPQAAPAREVVLAERDRIPDGFERGPFQTAVDYAARKFKPGLEYYERIVERIGFCGRDRVLDVGSGAGHWSIAFARHNREVLGVERDRDFVVIAKRMAVRFGVQDRVTFELGSVSDVVLPDRSFDLSCCHSVLMFVDHEVTLSRIARWTADGGSFYCGYTGEGARVQDVVEGVLDGDERRARHGLSVLLSDVRLRAGIGRGLGLRGLRREELEGMCHQLGFDVVDRPDVQDGRREFLGLPCTFDFVCRRRSGDPVEHLFGLDPDAREWSAGVASLVEAGLPRHALAVLEQLPRGKLSAPPLAELKLRARLLLGEEVEGDEALDRLDPPTRALLTGMSRQLAGAHEQALQAYADADAENSAPDMLTALCLLELKRHDEALALAAAQRDDGDGIGRLAITVAALIGARGLAAAREAVSAWQPSGATRVRSTLS